MLNFRFERAELEDVEELAPVFDEYRSFYGQAPDLEAAREFLTARLQHEESVVFMAVAGEGEDRRIYGIAQLYPSFSSITVQPVWILNDLFVTQEQRGQGLGSLLLEGVKGYAQGTGAKGLTLSTMMDNTGAQRLYEAHGYVRDESFYNYYLYF
ncbi:GNAT family N-acetyltransferase [Paenibacillus piscarius]|uniref:GNAT family N-acetyltransferase n=1 Tax=Paenibacillus piscarius TaxID=1089681 RepID=UPI001EE8EDD0|nr:GNAT family N-acetyltransferase [Paenibacillus piscarius]